MKKAVHTILSLLITIVAYPQQTEKIYLSGTGSDKTVNWDFLCTGGMNANKWSTIAVPSCWELQGFGKYDYGFAKDSIRGKEKGLYKHRFTAPASWKEKAIELVFEGVMTDAEVKINGKPAGAIHQGAFYAFRYDISKLLKYGNQNLLEVTVAKHSANESVNAAERRGDYWIFGGIFRPVYIEVLPKTYIHNVAIDAKANGDFEASFSTSMFIDEARVKIYADNGSLLVAEASASNYNEYFAHFEFSNRSAFFNRWTPESPNLYNAVFTIYKNGKAVHSITKKFGFRTVEVRQRDGIYVNGVKIKFKGVNRHSFRPETGRTLSKQNSIEDVLLMKDMNMNAVRMSYYPPDDHFLDVCDSLGLFVLDELAGWHGHYDTPTGKKVLNEMMVHDVNHPSIVLWVNGNEGGHNVELDRLFTEWDIQKRPVIHAWQSFNGIETQHYREYNYGIGNYDHGKEIVMPTEFLHGQFDGGHGAGLQDYWEKMWYEPLSAGGFLWDFADNAVVRKDKQDSLDADKHRAADGIVGPHHEKEGSYYAIKEIWSPVYMERREITETFDGRFTIENRYHFTNTNRCSFTWKLKQLETNKESKGDIPAPDLQPLQKGTLRMTLPADWKSYDVLYITALDPNNHELFTWSFPIIKPSAVALKLRKWDAANEVQLTEADSSFILTANKVQLSINKNNGRLQQVKNGKGIIPLSNGPVIQEGVNNFQNFTYHREGKNVIIESAFDRKNSYNTLQWTIYPTGWVRLAVNYFPAAYFTDMAGVNFSFPENQIKSVTYMGNGPYRVWKNRLKGNQFGIWNKTYNNTETGESWNYPEFKGYHSNIYWCTFNTAQQSFTVVTENEELFLRLFTPAWKTDQWHNYEPIFPTGDISFMQGIPSIGTKTQRNETTGPMGLKNSFYDYEKDPARALKMVLYFNFNSNNTN